MLKESSFENSWQIPALSFMMEVAHSFWRVRVMKLLEPKMMDLIKRFALREGYNDTGIEGLSVVVTTGSGERRTFVSLFTALIVQGRKSTTVSGERFEYGVGKCVVNCINRPSETVIEEASPEKPFLSLVLKLEPEVLSDIISTMPENLLPAETEAKPVFVIDCSDEICESFERLLSLSGKPEAQVLVPIVKREIYARLLISELGPWIRSLYASGSRSRRIMTAMNFIRDHYREEIEADALASSVHMSPATFRRHFHALAGCSPIQYQKNLRLFEARRLLTVEKRSVAITAQSAGYQSASQFTTDFRRFFGRTPREEVIHHASVGYASSPVSF